ncbi:monothiol glutaredoxin [Ceratobasidium sp. AG-Ba]|nr:monothiol glutaredoxin [Ceratobasidium sp. AG-Ba]
MPSFALPPQSKPRSMSATTSSIIGAFTRKHRRASGFLLLFLTLAAIFSFLFNDAYNTSSYISHQRTRGRKPSSSYPLSRAFGESKRVAVPAPQASTTEGEPLNLTPAMELGALVAFLADRAAQNALPATLDPESPIPADVVLDFNTRSDFAQLEVEDLVQDTWIRNPVVIFSKAHSPQGRDVKKIFASYKLKPAPTVVDIDERQDAAVLEPLLYRLTGQTSLPITLIGGRAYGSLTDIATAHESGELKRAMQSAGANIIPPKKKQQIPAPKLDK